MATWLSPKKIRDGFLAWQCRIRQVAMREDGGRPSSGMRPRVLDSSGRELSAAITTLLVPKEPKESTAFFRHQVMRTPDPRDTYERALTFLQADYFQDPDAFGDRLVSVFSAGAARPRRMHLGLRARAAALPRSLQGARNEAWQHHPRGGHLAQSPVQSCLARYGACARVQAGLDLGHARRLTKKDEGRAFTRPAHAKSHVQKII